jgi:hypothetical protein
MISKMKADIIKLREKEKENKEKRDFKSEINQIETKISDARKQEKQD